MNTDCRYLTAKIILMILYAISFSASLLGIISSAVNSISYTCDNNFLSLSIWKIVYGSVRMSILIILVLSYEFLKINRNDRKLYMIILISIIIGLGFDVVWSIIGSISLFTSTCRTDAFRLWVISLYCLSVEYASILCYSGHLIWIKLHD